MKKILLLLAALVSYLSLFTQDALLLYRHNYSKPLFVALKDISAISHSDTAQIMSLEEWNIQALSIASDIDSLVFIDSDTLIISDYAFFTCPDDNHPHMIDLGLPSGVLWSCCNVGASAPEENGGYYSWGETEEKDSYGWDKYEYYNSLTGTNKYLGDDIGGTEYDVAHVKWGGSWRMPKSDHFKELIDYCTYTWTQHNGINGTLVTGPNGASIFMPAAGRSLGDAAGQVGETGYYWTSTHYPANGEIYTYSINFDTKNTSYWYMLIDQRRFGNSVRPVITAEETKDECPVADAIDLGLPSGTKWASWNVGASAPEDFGGYYAWGETKEKDYYSWSSYIHCDGSKEYCHHIGDDIAGTEYDVAHVKWGDSWRMPTSAQIEELALYCTETWTQQNGVDGSLITGPNGNTIFLPAASYREKDRTFPLGPDGYYWSSTLSSTSESEVYGLDSNSNRITLATFINYRYAGFSVRPIYYAESIPDLTVSQSRCQIIVGNYATIEILSGSGNYEISNSNTDVIEVTLDDATITLKALSVGISYTTLKDTSSGQIISIVVIVEPFVSYVPADAIDLGLPSGTLWASWNVGATKPEEFGGYYAWGETEVKDNYARNTYEYYYEYNNHYYIGDDIAGRNYDVAHEKWGDSWSMPSISQIQELYENCTWEWTSQNNVNGMLVTGPNGASIFFPAAGYHWYDTIEESGSGGYYWSSSFNQYHEDYASSICFDSTGYIPHVGSSKSLRYLGKPVRAVISPNGGINVDPNCPVAVGIPLGLPSGTKWASWNVGASSPEEVGGYYAWGETEEKDFYSQNNYIYYDSINSNYLHIGDDIGGTEYDVASIKWGEQWKMPSKKQIDELIQYCTWTWTTQNDKNGYLVTGPNGNSIFLPLTGYRLRDNYRNEDKRGYYRSSSIGSTNSLAQILTFSSESKQAGGNSRWLGYPVRPVAP